jgi:hypothetical protein
MTIKWTKWDEKIVKEVHGRVCFYRELYEGNHAELFPRAKELIDKGEIVDSIYKGKVNAKNVKTPYIVANISKLVPEIPAMLVARSIGKVNSSLKANADQNESVNEETDEIIDGPRGDAKDNQITDLQQELINQISKNSKLQFEHWSNIVQHQVDGGLVGVPWNDERGLRIEFKQRDIYFPHDDDMGVDLAYERTFDEEPYLHIYRERVEEGNLTASHFLYKVEGSELEEVEESEALELLELEALEEVFKGRSRPFVVYWPNEKTFSNPLGNSALKNQEAKQDEINWTLTRSSIVYERNGKPRLAVSKEIMDELREAAYDRYGDERKIDHRDLEITTFDEKGKALEVIQIDVTKIGDLQWVKDLMKLMFIETKTSEKAVDFYLDGGSAAQSGVAKFYDLFISIVKAEQIQGEYIYFLQQLFENCLWLANQDDSVVIIEEPEITLKSMIPISRKELIEENVLALEKGAQSLETTVRRNNPNASEEWLEEELIRIEEGMQSDDTGALLGGRMTLSNMLDNRDKDGNPIDDEE